MSFSSELYKFVGSELESLGVKRAVPFEHPNYAVYFRRENEQIGEYLILTDARAKGAGMNCDLWFSVLDLPDDRIGAANLGLRINIYRQSALDDSIIHGIVKRAKVITDFREAFVRAAEEELRSPAFQTRRGAMLLEIGRNVRRLQEAGNGRDAWIHLLRLIDEHNLSVFRDAPEWRDVDRSIRAQCEELVSIVLALDENGNKATGEFLSEMLYERAVLIAS